MAAVDGVSVEGLTVLIAGPLVQLAKFQAMLEALDGTLSLALGIGADDGQNGVLRWSGSAAVPPAFGLRGPRKK